MPAQLYNREIEPCKRSNGQEGRAFSVSPLKKIILKIDGKNKDACNLSY